LGGEWRLQGRAARHVREVLKAEAGERLRLGKIDQGVTTAKILKIDEKEGVRLRVGENWEPGPSPLATTLVLALPRPKVFRRLLRQAVMLGFKDIHFCHSYRVEKSYWQSPLLGEEVVAKDILLALEQAQDVRRPRVNFHRFFKPFAQDVVPTWLAGGAKGILAHPYAKAFMAEIDLKAASPAPKLLALGPEGGWIDYEVKLWEEQGLEGRSFSRRTFSCEAALAFISGRLGLLGSDPVVDEMT
jgi:RsmE family RNA methyltransferase